MALSSASTRANALAQYRDSLAYEADPTGATARNFIAACRFLLTYPMRTKSPNDGEEEFDPNQVRFEKERAERFAAGCSAYNGGVSGSQQPRQFSFERFDR